jgi:hypothetical protein
MARMLIRSMLITVAALVPAGDVQAQQSVLATNGSTLQAPANLVLPGGANQCAARPYIGLNPGSITFIPTGQVSCMWWSAEHGPTGQIVANTYIPRGEGRVTSVRVRSGAAPAPLRFAIVSSGSGLCCTTKALSETVQPAAGQISQFAVDLPAGSGVGATAGSQYNDILAVVAVGPGSLPVSDSGAHGFLFGSLANTALASFLHPALALGESNTDVGTMDGYEVLLQYDWCGVPLTPTGQPAPIDGLTRCGVPPPPAAATPVVPAPLPAAQPIPAPAVVLPPTPAPLLRALQSVAPVAQGAATLALECVLQVDCTGLVNLVAAPAGARGAKAGPSLGRARYKIKAGRKAKLKVKLSAAGRKAIKRHKRLKVQAVVTTAGQPATTLALTLRR